MSRERLVQDPLTVEGHLYDQVYAAVDLMVTRAGAGTIAELAACGAPSIVVPWPDAAEKSAHHDGDEED